MFNSPTRKGFSLFSRVISKKGIKEMGAPIDAKYVVTELNDKLTNEVLFGTAFATEDLANLGTKSHTSLSDIGTNTHAQIDTHLGLVNEHIDWTAIGAGTIDPSNYVDNDTTYTGGNDLTLVGTTFNVDDSFIRNDGNDTSAGKITALGFDASNNTITSVLDPINAQDAASKNYVDTNLHNAVTVVDSSTIDFTLTGQQITASTIDSAINHDNLLGYVANEHVNWVAGSGTTENFQTGGTGSFSGLLSAGTLSVTSTATIGSQLTTANIKIGEDNWIGRSATEVRIVFDTTTGTDTLQFADCQTLLENDGSATQRLRAHSNTASNSSIVQLQRSRGTTAFPTQALNGDKLGTFSSAAYNGTAFKFLGSVDFVLTGNASGGSAPTAITFNTGSTSRVETMRVTAENQLLIGTTLTGARLVVKQAKTTGAIPVIHLEQSDVSEEIFQIASTAGVGNAVESVGAKTLTVTDFIKVTLNGQTRYLQVGTIA